MAPTLAPSECAGRSGDQAGIAQVRAAATSHFCMTAAPKVICAYRLVGPYRVARSRWESVEREIQPSAMLRSHLRRPAEVA